MMDAAQRARIRRLFYAEHWKVGTIVAELGVHHDTVERAIESDRFVRTQRQFRSSMLDPYKARIGEILKEHPRLLATRIFGMLRDRGYAGSVVQLRRYVKTVRPQRAEAYLRLQTLPGEQAQVDWGHFGKIRIGSALRTLFCFVFVLSWSRAMFAQFMLDATLEAFMYGHALAFQALGGVPREILYDNLLRRAQRRLAVPGRKPALRAQEPHPDHQPGVQRLADDPADVARRLCGGAGAHDS